MSEEGNGGGDVLVLKKRVYEVGPGVIEALNSLLADGGELGERETEDANDKRDAMFYPEPQPKMPDKMGAPPPAETYQAPEQGA